MNQLSATLGDYVVGSDGIPPEYVNAVTDRDNNTAQSLLRGCLSNPQSLQQLRKLLDASPTGRPARKMSDTDVVDRAATLIARGWMQLASPVLAPLNRGGGAEKKESAARVAAAPAAARRAPVDSDEPSFVPNLDQAALAAVLLAAALAGAAFCDECTRASRAA